jgi:hypothetical protein
MRRFLIFPLALCFIFSAVTSAAILFGQEQPLPEHLAVLHLTECAPPCWIGIVPNVTTVEEARTKIEAVYGQSTSHSLSFNAPTESNDTLTAVITSNKTRRDFVSISLHIDHAEKVRSIFFQFNSIESPNFGDFFVTIGPPARLTFGPKIQDATTIAYVLSFFDDSCSVVIGGSYLTDQIDWTRQPRTMIFSQPSLCGGEGEGWQPWHGFHRIYVSYR